MFSQVDKRGDEMRGTRGFPGFYRNLSVCVCVGDISATGEKQFFINKLINYVANVQQVKVKHLMSTLFISGTVAT